MSDDTKCMKCGSSNLALGKMDTTGFFFFRPEKAKFLTTQRGVAIKGVMCLDCGFVELVGNTEQAKALIKE